MNQAADPLVEIIVTRIREDADRARAQWNSPVGTTTRHFTVDDLLPADICMEAYRAFPEGGAGFVTRDSFRERKMTSAKLDQLPALLGRISYALQDPRVLAEIEAIAGADDLEPDPKLYAGGLSMMFKDGFLNPHIDNSHDAARDRYRRLNLLYYVSPDWKTEDGGNLELWDDKATTPVVLTSRFNRLIIMETNKTSLHSVSPVVAAGPRCCISSYYFSKVSPDGGEYFHVTSFKGRPEEKWKRVVGPIDNGLRNLASVVLKTGRGKENMNG